MYSLIKYFMHNKRLNYTLLLFLAYLGVSAYITIPKELFPTVELDKIRVSGSYAGSSATNMDKMAVRDIEDAIANISGIEKMETDILPGAFSIYLTLDEHANKINTLNNVKDAIAITKQYLPSDMNEPVATLLDRSRALIKMSLSSKSHSFAELSEIAKDVKSDIARIKNISEVSIRGDSDQELSIQLNSQAIKAYGLSTQSVRSAIANLSYIFPLGNIEQKGNFVFISMKSEDISIKEWRESVLNIDKYSIKLGDIADVKLDYPQDKTLSTFNNNPTLTLVITKADEGNSMELVERIKEKVTSLKSSYKGVIFNLYQDSSKPVKSRLDTVISNLMFGLILVFLSIYILINLRLALIVTLGIPFSFALGLLFIYYLGYSINIVSLLGGLIVIGIVVDDAIVVGENIQRHIDEGMEPKQAAFEGVKEMMLPVTLATLTTAAAFLPMFMLTGEISLFLILVPIVVVMILMASLIESFFFLPLHAQEFLRPTKSIVNWSPLENLYEATLHKLIHYKKSSLLLFLILIPLLTILVAKSMKFQFFPNFDGNNLYVSAKLNINTPLEESFAIAKEIEKEIIQHSKEFSIKSTTATAGYRRSLSGETEFNNNVFFITLELYDRVDTNWINQYLNPILNFSFNFNDPEKIREKQTFELSPQLEQIIDSYQKKFNFEELGVMEDKPGLIRSDIQINLSGRSDRELDRAIHTLEAQLNNLDSIRNYSDNIRYGKMEYKLKLNSYGEELGLNEAYLAGLLSAYFLEQRQAMSFNSRGIMEIISEDIEKDSIDTLLHFNIPLPNNRDVELQEIATITKERDYEKINKLNGRVVKTIYANVDKRSITPTEVLQQLQATLNALEAEGIKIELLGEKEKSKQLKSDMKNALVLAIFLILITLLLIFSKFKYVFMVMSVIPFSILGALIGHKLLGMNLTMPSIIGILGLAGVVVNDGIIMLNFLHGTHNAETFFRRAQLRLRPILITSITTFLGLFTLIFYATGQAVILQPIAISLGFGLIWGTLLNLLYLPTLYAVVNKIIEK